MHIQNPKRIALWATAGLLMIAAAAVVVIKLEERDARHEKQRLAELAARAKTQALAGAVAKLKKAVQTYQNIMEAEGRPLPPGRVITLEDLEQGRVLKKDEFAHEIQIEKFAYLMLPDEAPEKTVQLILVTDKGTATLNKKGEGSLFDK